MNKRKQYKTCGVAVLLVSLVFLLSGCTEAVTETLSSVADGAMKALTGDNTLYVESVSEDRYAYQTLTETQQLVYDELVYAFQNRETDVQIATTDTEEMELAYLAVRYDYADFFWVEGLSYVTYSRDDEITAIEITPEFGMTAEEQEEIQAEIDAEVDRLLADAPWDGSDYEKALYVYETLISEVDYVENAENSQNIVSAFLNHETVCQGYAYANQYLLEQLGIACTTVIGTVNGSESHAWNLAVLDGAYYFIDPTWGNSQYVSGSTASESASETFAYINYNYFAATSATLEASHQADSRIPLPECTATEDNYYIREGLYIEAWDAGAIGSVISEAWNGGEEILQIKFANVELCEQAMQFFVEDGRVFDYCAGLRSIQYLANTDSAVMVLLFVRE